VTKLSVETEAGAVGLDGERLERIDRHFREYVDDGRLPGWTIVVARRGKVAHLSSYGMRDVEAGLAVEPDTIFRLYSMTKPVTSVAAMMLYEEGLFELKEPVHRFLPSFRDQRVYQRGSAFDPVTLPSPEPMRMWHLLSHTSGLTYPFFYAHPVDAIYRAAGFDYGKVPDLDLAQAADLWGTFPLLFVPGTEWNYSVSTDVLGRVVEVLSGQTLDAFFAERIFAPLGMADTGFSVPEEDHGRLAALYNLAPKRTFARAEGEGRQVLSPPKMLSGGGGLVGTAHDYHRFVQMLVGEGALDGVRLLSPRTLQLMTTNHLPGGATLEEVGRPLFSETTFDGTGFGLGFSVLLDPAVSKTMGSKGLYAWGGAASTAFWVDPAEELTALFFTQLVPSGSYPIRSELQQLVYQAVVA